MTSQDAFYALLEGAWVRKGSWREGKYWMRGEIMSKKIFDQDGHEVNAIDALAAFFWGGGQWETVKEDGANGK